MTVAEVFPNGNLRIRGEKWLTLNQGSEFIQISVTALETEVVSESRGRAVFTQGYRSNTYQDSVRKVLELVREDGRWKILEEKTVS